MSGISLQARDLEATFAGLHEWIAEHFPEIEQPTLDTVRTNAVGGFSSDCLMFDVHGRAAEREVVMPVVARMPPSGEGVFRDYDLKRQFQVQHLLEPTDVPVARQLGYESDERYIGCPFILMEFVEGQVPPSQPPFYKQGWVVELAEGQRRTMYDNALAALCALHRLDVPASSMEVAQRPEGSGLDAEMKWCWDYIQWASEGEVPPEVRALADWCAERMPAAPPRNVICWGDARLGNMIFRDDMSVAALLDWEMVTVAPPELDLGWFLAFRAQTRARSGGADPEIQGLRTRQDSIQRYEKLLGREIENIEWYEMFSMLRLAGPCLGTKRIVRLKGIKDHFIHGFAPVEKWVLDFISTH